MVTGKVISEKIDFAGERFERWIDGLSDFKQDVFLAVTANVFYVTGWFMIFSCYYWNVEREGFTLIDFVATLIVCGVVLLCYCLSVCFFLLFLKGLAENESSSDWAVANFLLFMMFPVIYPVPLFTVISLIRHPFVKI